MTRIHKLIIILFITIFFGNAFGKYLEHADFYRRFYTSLAVKIELLDKSKTSIGTGTGFFVSDDAYPKKIIFVTNKHVVDTAEHLMLSIPLTDQNLRIITSKSFLIRETRKNCYQPNDSFDIAFLVLEKDSLLKSGLYGLTSITDSFFVDLRELIAGQPVIFAGYPMGMTINRNEPLLRNGIISGVDTITSIIYLDADAFGGSSGSPVFLDLASPTNSEFVNKYNRVLIGIISAYKPSRRFVFDEKTKKYKVQTENSGIAIVMPASKIREYISSILRLQK